MSVDILKKSLLEIISLPVLIGILLRIDDVIFQIIGILICVGIAFHLGSTYSEEFKIVKSWFYGLIKWWDRKKIANECEGEINVSSKKMSSELIGREPYKAKIQWVTGDEEDYFENGDLILRLKYSRNPNKNFITVAVRFVSRTLIPETKQYLHKTLSKSIDFFTVKKLLTEEKRALNSLFYEEYFYPEVRGNPKIKDCFKYFEIIDNVGIFNKVFIQELVFLGRKAHFNFEPEDPQITKEVVRLLNFLKDIAGKERGEDAVSGLVFTGELLKTGIVLVAEEEKRLLGNPNPFIRRVTNHLQRGIEDIYLIAWGSNIPLLKITAHNYLDKNTQLEKIKEQSYLIKDGRFKSHLVLYKNRKIG